MAKFLFGKKEIIIFILAFVVGFSGNVMATLYTTMTKDSPLVQFIIALFVLCFSIFIYVLSPKINRKLPPATH